jgi:hypothetical protein
MSHVEEAMRPITSGPKFHWFGYYDKFQFDPTDRFVLGMEVDFEGRPPRGDDVIRVGMVDLEDDNRWVELGESRAWCWQQGCMLQWRPGSETEVLWNDREGDDFVCHILDVQSGKRRTLPGPVYTVSPDGRRALAPDFRRINDTRPGYGYAGPVDPLRDVDAPEDSGIRSMDLETGERKLLLSIAEIAAIPNPALPAEGEKHYFNHLLYNTDGSRFIFLHRCPFRGEERIKMTRALTAAADGSDVHVLNDSGKFSHFIWRDARHLLAWSWRESHEDRMYLYEDLTDRAEAVAEEFITGDSHISYLPGGDWLLGDYYPRPGRKSERSLFLYQLSSRRGVDLGAVASPESYRGQLRCDLHPRHSRDGRWVCIDSVHEGDGRQLYLIDIAEITRP